MPITRIPLPTELPDIRSHIDETMRAFEKQVHDEYDKLVAGGYDIGIMYDGIPKYDEDKHAFTLTATFIPAHAR